MLPGSFSLCTSAAAVAVDSSFLSSPLGSFHCWLLLLLLVLGKRMPRLQSQPCLMIFPPCGVIRFFLFHHTHFVFSLFPSLLLSYFYSIEKRSTVFRNWPFPFFDSLRLFRVSFQLASGKKRRNIPLRFYLIAVFFFLLNFLRLKGNTSRKKQV